MRCWVCCFFFFQAEDGIRDLVRSRGLGDVYKRQGSHGRVPEDPDDWPVLAGDFPQLEGVTKISAVQAVSYTHLTLPTSDLV